ncbi:MAG: CDP-diacylglycerol--glycerol-3-phosphate 3-phosphatidyltransferase [Anaerovoracaceae bacterium]|nr:CDP-diacylglycerol--glycerol-3-phosphate 3-phosphatidyltransferase [Bacillota bacterium]MDY2670009.1 CDP-diacylglycerol--glycerol-3-phosphate 3-phosphatidyltransferase [Anaerovoracaceae bacterium]
MNLPNKLTTMRMILVPVFIVLYLMNYNIAALVVFVVASFTDFLDGHLARKNNLVTDYGKIMDPLADKLLVTSALVCMVQLQVVPAWMVIVILAREFAITGLRAVAASEGIVIAAAWSGKVKTVTQMIAVIFLLLNNWPFSLVNIPFATIMLWIAVIMTIYSGCEYIWKNRKIFSDM